MYFLAAIYTNATSPCRISIRRPFRAFEMLHTNAMRTITLPVAATIAPFDVYVVCNLLAFNPDADLINTSGWYNGDDAVELVKNGTPIDRIGIVGVDQRHHCPRRHLRFVLCKCGAGVYSGSQSNDQCQFVEWQRCHYFAGCQWRSGCHRPIGQCFRLRSRCDPAA